MSRNRTKPTESATKRDQLTVQSGVGRMIRAEMLPPGPLLEYIDHSGGNLKWCTTYFGGQSRAGL